MPAPTGSQWASRSSLNVPEKIRCDIGKEWRPSTEFSKNKLTDYVNRSRHDRRVIPSNSGIACRVHTGEPETKHQCQGPCGKVYALNAFSKNTRIRRVYWCTECTDWQLANEPGWSPYPAPFSRTTETDRLPNTSIAATKTTASRNEVEGNAMWPVQDDENEEEEDDGTGDGNDHGDNDSATTVTASESVITADRTLSVASGFEGSELGRSRITAPYARGSTDTQVPGRLRGGPGLLGGVGLFGGATGSSVGPTDTASVASTEPHRRGQEFNAWDSSGNMHRVMKAPTIVSETHTMTTSKTTRSNGWTKGAGRKCPPEPPSYLKQGKTASATDKAVEHITHLMDYQPAWSDDGESDDDI